MTYNLYINDTIGWPISAAYVRAELAKLKGKPCDVYISSLGGDVATALQIRQLFLEHGSVTAHLHGFVASAATIIATGCKMVKMGEFALFMIHKCSAWQEQWGQMNSEDIAAAIDKLTSAKNALDSIDQVIGSIYAQRTGKAIADLAEMMRTETWLGAEEAMAEGFVDEIIAEAQPAAISDDQRQRILACGYPLPTLSETSAFSAHSDNSESPSLFERIKTYIDDKAHRIAAEATPKNLQPPKHTAMNKNHPAILALLLVDGLPTTAEGKILLTEAQLQTLSDHLATLTADKQIAQQQVSDLTAQVEALKQADGDDTTHIEASGDQAPKNHTAAARADYEKLKAAL